MPEGAFLLARDARRRTQVAAHRFDEVFVGETVLALMPRSTLYEGGDTFAAIADRVCSTGRTISPRRLDPNQRNPGEIKHQFAGILFAIRTRIFGLCDIAPPLDRPH